MRDRLVMRFCIYRAGYRDYMAWQRGIETAVFEGGNEARKSSLGA